MRKRNIFESSERERGVNKGGGILKKGLQTEKRDHLGKGTTSRIWRVAAWGGGGGRKKNIGQKKKKEKATKNADGIPNGKNKTRSKHQFVHRWDRKGGGYQSFLAGDRTNELGGQRRQVQST